MPIPWRRILLVGVLSIGLVGARAQDPPSGAAKEHRRFEFGAELRLRGETRSGIGENPAREDGLGLSRLYLNFTMRPTKDVKVFLQGRDARVWGLANGRSHVPFQNPLDFRQAYVAIGRENGRATLSAGRMELDFLDARLLGSRDWSNVSPMFDGSTLALRRGTDSVTLLGVSQVDALDGFDLPSRTRFIYGAIGAISSWAEGHLVEPFFLTTRRPIERGSNLGGLLRTVGSRVSGAFAQGWDYQVLLAAQSGGEDDNPHRAWAGVWEVGKTIQAVPYRPRLGLEWSYASGDRDPLDGRSGTFDTLFPSPHGIYGEQDLVSHRNIKILKAGVELHPHRKLQVNADFLDLRLASLQDGLYRLNFRQVVAPPPGGASDGFVGSEVDLVVRYRPVTQVELRFGISHFFAGDFVIRNAPGGESQTFLNTSLTYRF